MKLPGDARSYLSRTSPRLTRDLRRIPDTRLFYERQPDGRQVVDGVSSEPVPDADHHSASYHLFFIGLTKESLTYTCEDAQSYWQNQGMAVEMSGDEPFPFTGEGQGWIGCTLAVSA